MKYIISFLLLFSSLFLINDVKATHVAGGEITYECLGNNQYKFTLIIYRDCSGASAPTTATLNATSSCGGNVVIPMTFVGLTMVLDTALLCQNLWGQTTCDNPNNPYIGIQQVTFEGIATLAPPCNFWEVSWSLCCRNSATNSTGQDNMYIWTRLYTANDNCNSSPTFSQLPYYACAGQTLQYSYGAVDPDGDSLTFQLVNAQQAANTSIGYAGGYSGVSPIPGVSINAQTGQLTFNPPAAGATYIVSVQVNEYDPVSGLLVGSIIRDMQFWIVSCPNNLYPYDASGIINYTGQGQVTGPNAVNLCWGDNFCFDVVFADTAASGANSFQPLQITTNATSALSGATFSTIGVNPKTAHICWQVPPFAPPSISFQMTVNDGACPIGGQYTSSYYVQIAPSTIGYSDTVLCQGQTAKLWAVGGTSFNWTVISGDSINPGVNFNYLNPGVNDTVLATPSQTTVYQVQANLAGGCYILDTITVTVVPDYTLIAIPDTSMCTDTATIYLDATTTGVGPYSYQWNNAVPNGQRTLQNPVVTPTNIQTYNYIVTVSAANGCKKIDTATVSITPPFPNNILLSSSADSACGGDTVQLNTFLLYSMPSACAINPGNTCPGNGLTNISNPVGSNDGMNGPNDFPSPYGNKAKSTKIQMLYRASELLSAGVPPGKLTGLGFDVSSLNGAANTYQFFSVKIGCTSATNLDNGFQTVTNTVILPTGSAIINAGQNIHNFANGYDWDGVSNLIVEICFQNITTPATFNPSVAYTNTSYNSCVVKSSNISGVCFSSGHDSVLTRRPNIKFKFCAPPDNDAFIFSWSPATGLSDTSVYNPLANPLQSTQYTVNVIDTFGACGGSASIDVNISSVYAGEDTVVCPGSSVFLEATPNSFCPNGAANESYTWKVGNQIVATTRTFTDTVYTNTTYVVYYDNGCGCIAYDSIIVEAAPPVIDPPTFYSPTCNATDGYIVFNVSGGVPPYQFSIDSGITWQAADSFPNLDIGFYTLMLKDSIDCYANPVPLIMSNPGAPTLDSIVVTNLTCNGSNDGVIELNVTGGGGAIQYSVDAGTTFQSSNQFTGLASGPYDIFIQDSVGCKVLDTVSVYENSAIQFVNVNIIDLDCYNDFSGEIQVLATGGIGILEYSIDGGGNFSTTNLYQGLDGGNYNIVVRDSNNCQISQPISLFEPQPLLIDLTSINDSCNGGNTGSIVVDSIYGGVAPFAVNWSNGISGNLNTSIGAGTYTVSVTDGNGCFNDSTVQITEPQPLVIDSFKLQNVTCFGFGNGFIQPYISGGTPPYKLSINGGITFTTANKVSNLGPGTYLLIVQDAKFCTTTMNFTITEPTQVTFQINNDTTVCQSNCVDLTAVPGGGDGNYTFLWTNIPGNDSTANQTVCPTVNSIYSVRVIDGAFCSSVIKSVTVNLYQPLAINISNDKSVCPGVSTDIGATATGGDGNGFNYQWTPSAGLTDPTIPNPTATPGSTTIYKLKVTDNCGSPSVTDSMRVIVFPLPVVDFEVSDTAGCEPLRVDFINNSTLRDECRWTIGGQTIYDCDQFPLLLRAPGEYNVSLEVTSPDGCSKSLSMPSLISVKPNPIARFTMSPEQVSSLYPEVQFEDYSKGDIASWSWNFAGLGTANTPNTKFTFPQDTGSYPVSLLVTTTDGCKNQTTVNVRVGPQYTLYIPNSFTPNGDGLNDIFTPVGIGVDISKYSMQIFDRWGKLLFETNDLSYGWNGRDNNTGLVVPPGVYIYQIKSEDITLDAKRHEYKGTITVYYNKN